MSATTIGDRSISLCGLGPMGMPIAQRLLRSGMPLTVWNRTAAVADALRGEGARIASAPADAAADVVITVLPDLPHVRGIVEGKDGLLDGWRRSSIVSPTLVVHGTVSPVDVAAYAAELRSEHDVRLVDAPLSGGTAGAAEGTLSIMVGGDSEVVAQLAPVFEVYGRTIRHFGGSGAGSLAKACNQVVVAATVAAVSEALLLARRGGLDLQMMLEILEGGLASSEVIRQKKGKWLHGDFEEGGSAVNQLKDLRFVEQAAESEDLRLPVSDAVRGLFELMVERGDGALDHTGVYRTLEAQAGGGDDGRSREGAG